MRTQSIAGRTVAIVPEMSAPERRAPLTHRSLFEELGVRPKTARGEGSEFESLREYVPATIPATLIGGQARGADARSCGNIKLSGAIR